MPKMCYNKAMERGGNLMKNADRRINMTITRMTAGLRAAAIKAHKEQGNMAIFKYRGGLYEAFEKHGAKCLQVWVEKKYTDNTRLWSPVGAPFMLETGC